MHPLGSFRRLGKSQFRLPVHNGMRQTHHVISFFHFYHLMPFAGTLGVLILSESAVLTEHNLQGLTEVLRDFIALHSFLARKLIF